MKKQITRVTAAVLAVLLMVMSCMPAYAASGRWIKSGSRWWYCHTDNTYTVDGWEKIDNYWYRFDKKGWMQTGWVKDKGNWYYLAEKGRYQGRMRTGSFYDTKDGNYYYLKANGVMATGWVKDSYGNWQYYDKLGRLVRSQIVDGKYYIDSSGYWIKDPGLTLNKQVVSVWMAYQQLDGQELILNVYKSTENKAEFEPFIQILKALKSGDKTLNLKHDDEKCERYCLGMLITYSDGSAEVVYVYPDGRLYCDGYDYTVDMDALLALYKAL